MTRATYHDIASVIVTQNEGLPRNKKFIVCPPSEPDEALTVYPPSSYYDDQGVDIFLKNNTAEFFVDGYKVKKLDSIQEADAVAAAILDVLNEEQIARAKEHEE